MVRDTQDGDETCSCTTLRKAARRVSLLYDEALAPSGLRITQYALLAELGRTGPLTVGELAHAMVMERNGLGHNLRPLERDGLVRLDIGHDRRSRVVTLTDDGRHRLTEAKLLWQHAQDRFRSVLGTDETRTLRALSIAAAYADFPGLPGPGTT